MRGKLKQAEKKSKNLIVTGDNVKISESGETLSESLENENIKEGIIEEILPRKNKLYRRILDEMMPRHKKNYHKSKPKEQIIASNIDRILIMSSCANPDFNSGFVDRILVFCEKEQIAPLIIVSKSDLLLSAPSDIDKLIDIYKKIDYELQLVSTIENKGLEELKRHLQNKTCVTIGPSGVGKSSLINKLCEKEILQTNEVNKFTHKGVHTTTNVVLIRIPTGGFIIDTPGIKEFAYPELEKWELSLYFREMARLRKDCKFKTCTHTHEPECAIKKAVQEGIISTARYESYERILQTIR